MSYDIEIRDHDDKIMKLQNGVHYIKGANYIVSGSPYASINITYNYADYFRQVFGPEGIRSLYGEKVSETLEEILKAILQLSGPPSEDYWEKTEGNARQALINLLNLGILFPDGYWSGD